MTTREQNLEQTLRYFVAEIRAYQSPECEECEIIGPLLRQADAVLSAPKAEAVEPVDYQWREGRSTRHAPDEWDWGPWHAGRLPAHVENHEYLRYEERVLYTSPAPALTDEAVERVRKGIQRGFMTRVSDSPSYYVKIAFRTLKEAGDFHAALLAAFPSKGEGQP